MTRLGPSGQVTVMGKILLSGEEVRFIKSQVVEIVTPSALHSNLNKP